MNRLRTLTVLLIAVSFVVGLGSVALAQQWEKDEGFYLRGPADGTPTRIPSVYTASYSSITAWTNARPDSLIYNNALNPDAAFLRFDVVIQGVDARLDSMYLTIRGNSTFDPNTDLKPINPDDVAGASEQIRSTKTGIQFYVEMSPPTDDNWNEFDWDNIAQLPRVLNSATTWSLWQDMGPVGTTTDRLWRGKFAFKVPIDVDVDARHSVLNFTRIWVIVQSQGCHMEEEGKIGGLAPEDTFALMMDAPTHFFVWDNSHGVIIHPGTDIVVNDRIRPAWCNDNAWEDVTLPNPPYGERGRWSCATPVHGYDVAQGPVAGFITPPQEGMFTSDPYQVIRAHATDPGQCVDWCNSYVLLDTCTTQNGASPGGWYQWTGRTDKKPDTLWMYQVLAWDEKDGWIRAYDYDDCDRRHERHEGYGFTVFLGEDCVDTIKIAPGYEESDEWPDGFGADSLKWKDGWQVSVHLHLVDQGGLWNKTVYTNFTVDMTPPTITDMRCSRNGSKFDSDCRTSDTGQTVCWKVEDDIGDACDPCPVPKAGVDPDSLFIIVNVNGCYGGWTHYFTVAGETDEYRVVIDSTAKYLTWNDPWLCFDPPDCFYRSGDRVCIDVVACDRVNLPWDENTWSCYLAEPGCYGEDAYHKNCGTITGGARENPCFCVDTMPPEVVDGTEYPPKDSYTSDSCTPIICVVQDVICYDGDGYCQPGDVDGGWMKIKITDMAGNKYHLDAMGVRYAGHGAPFDITKPSSGGWMDVGQFTQNDSIIYHPQKWVDDFMPPGTQGIYPFNDGDHVCVQILPYDDATCCGSPYNIPELPHTWEFNIDEFSPWMVWHWDTWYEHCCRLDSNFVSFIIVDVPKSEMDTTGLCDYFNIPDEVRIPPFSALCNLPVPHQEWFNSGFNCLVSGVSCRDAYIYIVVDGDTLEYGPEELQKIFLTPHTGFYGGGEGDCDDPSVDWPMRDNILRNYFDFWFWMDFDDIDDIPDCEICDYIHNEFLDPAIDDRCGEDDWARIFVAHVNDGFASWVYEQGVSKVGIAVHYCDECDVPYSKYSCQYEICGDNPMYIANCDSAYYEITIQTMPGMEPHQYWSDEFHPDITSLCFGQYANWDILYVDGFPPPELRPPGTKPTDFPGGVWVRGPVLGSTINTNSDHFFFDTARMTVWVTRGGVKHLAYDAFYQEGCDECDLWGWYESNNGWICDPDVGIFRGERINLKLVLPTVWDLGPQPTPLQDNLNGNKPTFDPRKLRFVDGDLVEVSVSAWADYAIFGPDSLLNILCSECPEDYNNNEGYPRCACYDGKRDYRYVDTYTFTFDESGPVAGHINLHTLNGYEEVSSCNLNPDSPGLQLYIEDITDAMVGTNAEYQFDEWCGMPVFPVGVTLRSETDPNWRQDVVNVEPYAYGAQSTGNVPPFMHLFGLCALNQCLTYINPAEPFCIPGGPCIGPGSLPPFMWWQYTEVPFHPDELVFANCLFECFLDAIDQYYNWNQLKTTIIPGNWKVPHFCVINDRNDREDEIYAEITLVDRLGNHRTVESNRVTLDNVKPMPVKVEFAYDIYGEDLAGECNGGTTLNMPSTIYVLIHFNDNMDETDEQFSVGFEDANGKYWIVRGVDQHDYPKGSSNMIAGAQPGWIGSDDMTWVGVMKLDDKRMAQGDAKFYVYRFRDAAYNMMKPWNCNFKLFKGCDPAEICWPLTGDYISGYAPNDECSNGRQDAKLCAYFSHPELLTKVTWQFNKGQGWTNIAASANGDMGDCDCYGWSTLAAAAYGEMATISLRVITECGSVDKDTSEVVTGVIVDNVPPVANITNPDDGEVVTADYLNLDADITEACIETIEWHYSLDDGDTWFLIDNPDHWLPPNTLAEYLLRVRVYDCAGLVGCDEVTFFWRSIAVGFERGGRAHATLNDAFKHAIDTEWPGMWNLYEPLPGGLDMIPVTTYTYDPDGDLYDNPFDVRGKLYPGDFMFVTYRVGAGTQVDSIFTRIPAKGTSNFERNRIFRAVGADVGNWVALYNYHGFDYYGLEWTIYDESRFDDGLWSVTSNIWVAGTMFPDVAYIILDSEDPQYTISYYEADGSNAPLPTIMHPTFGLIPVTNKQLVNIRVDVDQTVVDELEGSGRLWSWMNIFIFAPGEKVDIDGVPACGDECYPCGPGETCDRWLNEPPYADTLDYHYYWNVRNADKTSEGVATVFIKGRDTAGNFVDIEEAQAAGNKGLEILIDITPPAIPDESKIVIGDCGTVTGQAGAVGQDLYGLGLMVKLYGNSTLTNLLTSFWANSDGSFNATLDPGPAVGTEIWVVAADHATNESNATSVLVTSCTYRFTYNMNTGWNMVSVPVEPEDATLDVLFPDAMAMWKYAGNYQVATVAVTGEGYWLLYNGINTEEIAGLPVRSFRKQLVPGWNLIGSCLENVAISGIVDVNTGLFPTWVSPLDVWKWEGGGYLPTGTISAGRAVWMLAQEAGTIEVSVDEASLAKEPVTVEMVQPTWMAKVTASSGSQVKTIEFGAEKTATGAYDQLIDRAAPPVPPVSELNAFFAGQFDLLRDIRGLADNNWTLRVDAESPITLSWDVTEIPQELSAQILVNGSVVDMRAQDRISLARGSYDLGITVKMLPEAFSLAQNYPNPFNPETKISFGLPEDATVVLRVYNVLGQEIRTLVNEPQVAGFHTVTWDGTNDNGEMVSTGVYIYRITAGQFTAAKQMVLMK